MRRRNDAAAPSQTTPGPTLPGEPDLFSNAREKAVAAMGSPVEGRPSTEAKKDPPPPARPAPPGLDVPKMPGGYERIVTTVFDMPDPDKEFQRLKDELELSDIKPSRAEYGTIVDALDQAEKNAQAAVELLANFDLVYEAFQIDELVVRGAYRDSAKAALEEAKREEFAKNKADMGSKATAGKQITEADVEAAMAAKFPDETKILAERRAQAKGARDACKSLCERWADRSRNLRAMVLTTRAASSAHYG